MQRWYSLLLPRSVKSISWLAILIVFAIGSLALVGWMLDITLLKSIEPRWTPIKVITAIILILSAMELALLQRIPSAVRKYIVLQAPGLLVGLVGLLTIVIYAIAMITGQEPPLKYVSFFNLFLSPLERMALLTAILFLINGCAMILLASDNRRAADIAHAIALPGFILSYLIPVSYLLGVQSMHESMHTAVALNTGIAFCALSIAIFCTRSDTWLMRVFTGAHAGSVMARRLLPALLVIPLLIGWLRIYGEHAGYFESAVGVVLVAITYTVFLLWLLWLSARYVNQTDDKQQIAEQALRESEQKLRLFIEHAPAAIAMFDLDMRYMAVSQRWLTDYELADHDIIGRSHYEIFPEIPERWRKVHQRGLAGVIEKCEEDPFPRLDGSIDWVRWEVHPWHDHKGNIGGIIIFSEVITERKQAEEELNRYREHLEDLVKKRTNDLEALHLYSRSLIEASLDPLITISAEGKVMDVNKATEEVTGVPRINLIGSDFLDYFTEPAKAQAGYEKVFREGFVKDYPLAIRHVSGRITEVLYNATTYRNEDGEVQGVFAAARDISELRKTQQALQKSHDELEERNILLHKEMIERVHAEEEKNKLEVQLIQAQRMEALGKLAGGIAHDLNNILQPILINSEMISDKLTQGTQEREYLDQIIDAAQLGKNLIKQIKMFGSSQKPILRPIPIGQVVHKALAIVKRTLSSDIKLNQHVPMNEHMVNADPIQINQLVLNLCTNAAQSMTPQGGTLDVSLDETVVTQSTPAISNDLKPGKYIILTVRDTGSGIEPEIMKNIFDPFFTTRKSEGTGLGLAVVYEVVKNSQGSMLLSSEVGKGTRFEIFFPLHLDSLN